MTSSRPFVSALRLALLVSANLFHPSSVPAISVGTTEADTSPEAELKSFTVLDGFEVSLWASEKDGLTKPISMRWDERGRLWVITAKSYPQPEPGEVADDKVLILEDTKHSGHADKVTVFADGLKMPMGIELAPSATWPQPPEASKKKERENGEAFSPNSSNAEKVASGLPTHSRSDSFDLKEGRHPMAAYVGEGEKLWIMRDLDGDGKADVREVVFSGFGTGDTHQCINSFTWTPDGALMFSQGLHCYSNVTTPWGGRRLYGAGFWMYRPLRAQLTPYPTGFPLNAWGTVYDDAGQPFTVAGAAGMFWTTPLLVPQFGDEQQRAGSSEQGAASGSKLPAPSSMRGSAAYSVHLIEGRALPNNGQIVKQGMLKYCGIDIPRNAHWPADMHGELVSGGFFENCIYRHKLQPDKANPSGYEAVRQPDLIKSSSVAFRPVDVKFGPDGALYISDWYNPIIGHYQASFRHPDRDKTHGRIWRVVKKGAPLVQQPDFAKASTGELLRVLQGSSLIQPKSMFDEVRSGIRWEQYQALRLLMGKPRDEVLKELQKWNAAELKKASKDFDDLGKGKDKREIVDLLVSKVAGAASTLVDQTAITALNAHSMVEDVDDALLAECVGLPSVRVKAIATRTIALFHDRLKDPLGLLSKSIAEEDPRVRLEAIAACAQIPKPESIAIALRALDKPMDSFLDRTLELAVHSLAPQWEPALRDGKLTLPPKHLAWLLDKKSDGDTLARIRTTLHDKPATFDPESRRALLLMLAKRGGSDDVGAALAEGITDDALLNELADLVESQQIKAPANAEQVLSVLTNLVLKLGQNQSGATPRLIGLWKVKAFAPALSAMVKADAGELAIKRESLIALARLNAEQELISQISADDKQPYALRAAAVEALSINHITPAAKAALALMPQAKTEEDMRALLAPFLVKAGRAKPLIAAITETPPSKEAADLASRALAMMGRNEPELSAALNKILGRTAVVMPFDSQWVSGLANEAIVAGNAKRGDEIFHRPTMACTGCHQINNIGGIIGPQLDAVGRGVPVELLVEAVMWPQRQIKEGYVATTVVMKDGRSIVGYKSKETDTELTVRDMATKVETTLQKKQMQQRTDAGSLMPDGLTASLSREELRDLIAYLASLGKEEKK